MRVTTSTRAVVLVAAAALLLAGCGAGAGSSRVGPGPPGASTEAASPRDVPDAPAGTRWVGIDDRAVAVPLRWETVAGVCASPGDRQVAVQTVGAAAVRCAVARPGAPAITLSPPGSIGWSPRRGVRCRASTLGPCSARVGEGDGGFRVTLRGPDAQRELETVIASATTVPDGWVTVPAVPYGVADRQGLRVLEAAGLVGVAPDVDWPHYVVGTDPATGSVVAEGSAVALVPGDG